MHRSPSRSSARHGVRVAFTPLRRSHARWSGPKPGGWGWWAVLASCFVAVAAGFAAEPAVHQGFDGPELVWRLVDEGRVARVLVHDRVHNQTVRGGGAERLAVVTPSGESVLFLCPTGRVPVLDELEIRLQVRANRPAVRLAARVVLPRTVDGTTGAPRSVIVPGPLYNRAGSWQPLVLRDIPRLLADQVRVLRASGRASVDPGEAYVDAVVLVVSGEPTGTIVWTDELEVDGIVLDGAVLDRAVDARTASLSSAKLPSADASTTAATGWRRDVLTPGGRDPQRDASTVRLHGSTLLVGGKPFVPRAVDWNGEPLEFLAARGFNVVLLPQPPTGEQTAEAHQRGLWLLCPPPRPDTLERDGLVEEPDRVLAWYLGAQATNDELEYVRRWLDVVRRHDPDPGRPVLVTPETDWLPLSKSVDALLVRHPWGSSVSAAEYARWLEQVPQWTRPGTPFWAQLGTQVGDATRQQAASLVSEPSLDAGLDDGRLEELVQIACTLGSRGFVFQSSSPLNESDSVSRRRAAVLELVNRRLQLVEAWLASGKVVGEATCPDPATTAVVLQVERARLLVPLERAAGRGAAPPAMPASPADKAYVVPGVPESNRAYLLSLGGLRPLSSNRIAGGLRVVVESDDDGFVLMTEDPQVVAALQQRLAHSAPRAVRLQRALAVTQIEAVEDTGRRLGQLGYEGTDEEPPIASARAEVERCNALLASGQVEEAYQHACAARRVLEPAADLQRRSVGHADGLTSSPLAASYDTLVQHATFLKSILSLSSSDNRLDGGDFEDLSNLARSGWLHVSHPLPGVQTRAELSAESPYHGGHCLQLTAVAASPDGAPPVLHDAPVWVTSPPMPIRSGQVVEITGWIRVPEPIIGSEGGLEIVDSFGGPELALHVDSTRGWQPFRLLRAAPETTELTVTFALAGLGTASVDAVMVRALDPPSVRRLPPVAPSATPETPGPQTPTLYPATGR